MAPSAIRFVLQLSIGGLLVVAASQKAATLGAFTSGLRFYGVSSPALARALAVGVIGAECLIGISLLGNLFPLIGAVAGVVLFLFFSALVGWNLFRGARVPCLCFGAMEDSEVTSGLSLVRTATLLAGSSILTWLLTMDVSYPSASAWMPLLTVAFGAMLLVRFLAFLPETAARFRDQLLVGPVPTNRRSFRHHPLTESLKSPRPADRLSVGPAVGIQHPLDGLLNSD